MDAVTSLNNELLKLEQIVKAFKVGAISAREETIEDKITDAVKALTISDAKLLLVKAKIEESKQPPDEELIETDLLLLLDEYEKELAKFVLLKSFLQHCVEASAIHRMRSGDTSVDEETFSFVDKTLKEIAEMQITLHEMMEEEQEISQKIVEKKEELKALQDKDKLEEIKKKKQDSISHEETESLQLKKNNEVKLEKLNTMRFFMTNVMTICKTDYLKEPKWTELLLEIQNPINMQDLASGELDIASWY